MSEKNIERKNPAASVIAFVVVLAVAAGAAWFTRGIWTPWLNDGAAGDTMRAGAKSSMSGMDMSESSGGKTTPSMEQTTVIYTCPMHPGVKSDKPGDCPICGMTLVKKEVPAVMTETTGMKMSDMKTEPQSTIYHCPMCPGSESTKPGKCPTCGMDLVPMEPGAGAAHANRTGMDMKPGDGAAGTGEMTVYYTCPMHPGIKSDKPGKCPICGMTLVKKEAPAVGGSMQKPAPAKESGMDMKAESVGASEAEEGATVVYTCPMHPDIIRDKPGSCPICGMTLVKKTIEKKEKMSSGKGSKPLSEAVRRVSLDPRDVEIANVKTDTVGYSSFSRDVNTVGRIAYNEDTIQAVAAWFPGRIEKISVKYEGETVRNGQTVMTVYSPELVASQKELLIARDAAKGMSGAGYEDIKTHSQEMLEAARKRLLQWGMSTSQIDKVEKTGKFMERVRVTSPVAGTVVSLGVREGDYVKEGTELFKVADLGSVWINAEVYEYEFSKAEMGAKVVVTAESYPSMTFEGRVSFISPEVDNQSRTVKVRVTLPNPGGLLKPHMFVDARIISQPRRALTVPASAVLYTGKHDIVWVETGKGMYESRDVKLGERSEGYYEVVSGLTEGDRVVTEGGFLIDSEAELNSGAGGMHM